MLYEIIENSIEGKMLYEVIENTFEGKMLYVVSSDYMGNSPESKIMARVTDFSNKFAQVLQIQAHNV
jgi:hypothetical protein